MFKGREAVRGIASSRPDVVLMDLVMPEMDGISSILSKLHLASRTQATLYALREGLASLDDGGEASRKP